MHNDDVREGVAAARHARKTHGKRLLTHDIRADEWECHCVRVRAIQAKLQVKRCF